MTRLFKFATAQSWSWLIDLFLLGMGCLVFYMLWLGHYPLFTPDEGRYAEVAREMVRTHDYITPRVDGVAFLDKPILYYWLEACAMHFFGVKEWAIRLFPALFGVAGVLAVYLFGRGLFDRRTGILSASILATTPLYFGAAHYANLDLEVAVLMSGCLLAFVTAFTALRSYKQSLYFLLGVVLSAFAFLTKGLIGIVLPGAIIVCWLVLLRRWSLLAKMPLVIGMILFVAIALPWYALVARANPEFLYYFFVTQQFARFVSVSNFNNQMSFWFYIPVVLIGFLPWTGFLLQAFGKSFRAMSANLQSASIQLYLLLWIVIFILFFSIPHSKLVGYIVPVYPALALLVGHYVSTAWEKLRWRVVVCMVSVALLLFGVVWYAEKLNPGSVKPLILMLKPMLRPDDEVVNYFRFYYDTPIYLDRYVTLVADWHDSQLLEKDNWMRELRMGVDLASVTTLMDDAVFWKHFNSHTRVFVFADHRYLDRFKLHAQHYVILGENHGVLLMEN